MEICNSECRLHNIGEAISKLSIKICNYVDANCAGIRKTNFMYPINYPINSMNSQLMKLVKYIFGYMYKSSISWY